MKTLTSSVAREAKEQGFRVIVPLHYELLVAVHGGILHDTTGCHAACSLTFCRGKYTNHEMKDLSVRGRKRSKVYSNSSSLQRACMRTCSNNPSSSLCRSLSLFLPLSPQKRLLMRRLARMLLGSYFRRSAKNSFTGYFSWKYIHVNTHSHTHTYAHTQAVAQTNRQTLINNVGAGLASGSTVPGLGFWSTPGGAGVATAAPLSIHLALSSPSALGLCVWGGVGGVCSFACASACTQTGVGAHAQDTPALGCEVKNCCFRRKKII